MTEGGCLCGEVRFVVEEFSSGVFKCHCSKCRKAFGGASSAAVLAREQSFAWVQGSEGIREFHTESGFPRCFCSNCGSILPHFLPKHQLHWIPAGLLDSDAGLRLKHHIHVNSKAGWEILDTQTQQHGEGFDS